METYQEFLNRIYSFEKREVFYGRDYFRGNPFIAHKVDEENRFKLFFGDTIVFDLDAETKEKVTAILDQLYTCVPECFCEKLIPSTLHMTLHDLSSCSILKYVAEDTFINEWKVAEIFKKIQPQKIAMKTTYIFNMVGTSLVLGLCPASEEDYEKLMKLYELFQPVQHLSYPLTPHITLAYYNVHGFPVESAERLEALVYDLNAHSMDIVLDTEQLVYQKFFSMNKYASIFGIKK